MSTFRINDDIEMTDAPQKMNLTQIKPRREFFVLASGFSFACSYAIRNSGMGKNNLNDRTIPNSVIDGTGLEDN